MNNQGVMVILEHVGTFYPSSHILTYCPILMQICMFIIFFLPTNYYYFYYITVYLTIIFIPNYVINQNNYCIAYS